MPQSRAQTGTNAGREWQHPVPLQTRWLAPPVTDLCDIPAELVEVFQAQRPPWAWLFVLSEVRSEGNEGGESADGLGRPSQAAGSSPSAAEQSDVNGRH